MSRSSASLIEAHEDEYYPIPDLSAADMLRFLIDQRGISRQTLSRETGIAQLDNHGSAPRGPRDDATPYRDLRPVLPHSASCPATAARGCRPPGCRQTPHWRTSDPCPGPGRSTTVEKASPPQTDENHGRRRSERQSGGQIFIAPPRPRSGCRTVRGGPPTRTGGRRR